MNIVGKRTYALAILLVALAVYGWLTGELETQSALKDLVLGAALAALRSGIQRGHKQ